MTCTIKMPSLINIQNNITTAPSSGNFDKINMQHKLLDPKNISINCL